MFEKATNIKYTGKYFGGSFIASKQELTEIFGFGPNAGVYKNSWLVYYNNKTFGVIPGSDAVEPRYQQIHYDIIATNKNESDIILQ